MVEKQSNEPVAANEEREFDSSDPFEVLRNADKFEEQERESEKQLKAVESEEVTEDEKPAEKAAEAETPPEKPKTYKFAGKEYTPDDLVKEYSDPEKILDLLTAREQYKHLNKKHAEVMEEYKAAKLKGEVVEAIKQTIPQQPIGVPADPKQVVAQARQALQPVVQSWVQNGIVEQDTLDAVPDIVAILAYQQLEYNRKVAEVDKIYNEQIRPVIEYAGTVKSVGYQQNVVNALENTINRVQSRGGVYGNLSDLDTKAGFVQYLAELNPEVDILFSDKADEFLARQFIAYNSEQLLSMYSQANQQSVPRGRDTSRATGEGSGARPGRASEANADIKKVLFTRG